MSSAQQADEISAEEFVVWTNHGLALPLRTSPIRFAVQMTNGLTSNAWGVRVERKDDAYIYCRDAMRGQKVSLHASGKQHIAFDDADAVKNHLNLPDRFLNQWREPHHGEQAVATFRLLFPPWGVAITAQQREVHRKRWNKNQILLEGNHESMIVVSFVILDSGVALKKAAGSPPSTPLGVLPLREGKTLFVIASRQPEGNLKEVVHDACRTIVNQRLVSEDHLGEVRTSCFTGYQAENSAYMLVVPIAFSVSK